MCTWPTYFPLVESSAGINLGPLIGLSFRAVAVKHGNLARGGRFLCALRGEWRLNSIRIG